LLKYSLILLIRYLPYLSLLPVIIWMSFG